MPLEEPCRAQRPSNETPSRLTLASIMKNYLIILILFLSLTSCGSDGNDIRNFKVEEIDFEKMPIEVQQEIKEFYRPTREINSDGDTLYHYGLKDELICLDSGISQCEYKVIWSKLVSSWLDHVELIIDDKKIIIEQGVHVFNEPYVVHDGLLYCRTNMNAKDLDDPSKDEFKMIEIKKN